MKRLEALGKNQGSECVHILYNKNGNCFHICSFCITRALCYGNHQVNDNGNL